MAEAENIHLPVLVSEVVALFGEIATGTIVDATLGLGGHSQMLLRRCPTIEILGIDQDEEAIAIASQRLSVFGKRAKIVHGNFREIGRIIGDAGIRSVAGVLADLGVSSLQFDSPDRGFSFRFNSRLDMRMDAGSGSETVAEILASRSEEEIANIIYNFGEERASRRIARRIVQKRERGEPVETTRQLADIVASVVKKSPRDKVHPATKTFQALRIAANQEIEILEQFIIDSAGLLQPSGILGVITFHSLEDRIVKHTFQKLSGKCTCPPRIPECVCGAVKTVEIITKRPITPDVDELKVNPRSRSAKLRAIKKIDADAN